MLRLNHLTLTTAHATIPSTLKTGPYVYRRWDPPLCTVPPGAIHLKGWPLLRMCECVRVGGGGGGSGLGNLCRSSEPGSSQKRRGFGVPAKRPRTQGGRGPDSQHSAQHKRGSSTFIGAGREPVGVSSPGLEGC